MFAPSGRHFCLPSAWTLAKRLAEKLARELAKKQAEMMAEKLAKRKSRRAGGQRVAFARAVATLAR